MWVICSYDVWSLIVQWKPPKSQEAVVALLFIAIYVLKKKIMIPSCFVIHEQMNKNCIEADSQRSRTEDGFRWAGEMYLDVGSVLSC